jgi:ubiquinone/menaquinone biosynthesis C-methylase UbiE
MSFLDRAIFHKEPSRLPEKRLQTFIGGGFDETGKEYLDYFLILGNLEPDETLLDVGCGCGRMSLPLTTFLNQKGQYLGFDIVKESITWCQENITSRYPNFLFTHADIYNQFYNPKGKIASDKYIFPYPDNKFDLVILTSIFTHLVPRDMEHYLSEISRTLKKNGRCLITFFLLNEETQKLFREKPQEFNFIYGDGVYRTIDPVMLEAAISYDETYIRDLFSKNNLVIREPIQYGSWCGRETYLSFQDIVIGYKN